ncbi:MAG: hypothetical protein M1817_000204 [Caeruleum heppii]|nr:MAG: hypothetical protein M1817_000204 [Caeruleum heppii]
MARKFLIGTPFEFPPWYDPKAYEKKLFFFYGTLMDPKVLAEVLHLRDRPKLVPAEITGYKLMLWGQYPAILVNPGRDKVYGMAYEVQSHEEERRLEAYETDRYRNSGCLLELQDGRAVRGRAFRWAGDADELKEGSFNLKDWQMNKLGV